MKLPHKPKYKVIDAVAIKVYWYDANDKTPNRIDTKIVLMCQKCGGVRTKKYLGKALSPGNIRELAKLKGWDFDSKVFV